MKNCTWERDMSYGYGRIAEHQDMSCLEGRLFKYLKVIFWLRIIKDLSYKWKNIHYPFARSSSILHCLYEMVLDK